MEARANVTKGRPGRCMTGGFGMDRRAFGRACGDRAFGLGAFGPDVFKRTPSIADLKPACRFVAKHSYHGDVILLVVDAAPENGFAVPGPGKAAPAAAYVDAGGFAAVLTTGSASVPSNDSESGATAKGVPRRCACGDFSPDGRAPRWRLHVGRNCREDVSC